MSDMLLIKVWNYLQDQIDSLREDVTVLQSKTSNSAFPTRWMGMHSDSNVLVGNPITRTLSGSAYLGMYAYQSTAASGDTFTNGFNLKSGTYTLRIYGMANTNSGILNIYVDGVLQGTQDWYAGSLAATYKDIAIEVESDGPHTLRGTVYLKNFSSTGFYMYLSYMTIIPAVD